MPRPVETHRVDDAQNYRGPLAVPAGQNEPRSLRRGVYRQEVQRKYLGVLADRRTPGQAELEAPQLTM